MEYSFFTCDVFTEQRFGGNPLAVLPNASGLSTEQMQIVAREFNYSETTFVLPPERGGTRQVRIFNTAQELPFAGHPNIGTAFVLAENKLLEGVSLPARVVFEEPTGLVPIEIEALHCGAIRCELKAPEALQIRQSFPVDYIARMMSLSSTDIDVQQHGPQQASVGLPYIMIAVRSREALERVSIDIAALSQLADDGVEPWVYVYCRSADEFDIRCRMFAPLSGTPEDPATGSACAALAGLLAHYEPSEDGDFTWRMAQGVEMQRSSVIETRCSKRQGVVEDVWIAGRSVSISRGCIRVE